MGATHSNSNSLCGSQKDCNASFVVKKPVDASDIKDLDSAKKEIIALRKELLRLESGVGHRIRADRECHIIAFNDVYNLKPMFEDEPVGGITRFCTLVKELAEDIAPRKPLIVFAGDFVGPSLMSTVTKGAHFVEVLNVLGVHFATFGNHEFDYGYKSLKDRLAGVDDDVQHGEDPQDYPETTTRWLCSNIHEVETKFPCGGERVERDVLLDWDDVKVGLFAVSENWLPGCSQLKDNELEYEDYIEVARRTAKSLKERGAEVVIALTHNRVASDRKLTAAVPEIDLLLGGHDHFYKYDRRARVLKGGQEFRWVNHVCVEMEGDGTREIHVSRYDADEDVKEDPDMVEVVKKYERIEHLKFSRVVGKSAVPLDATEECVRFGEGALPNWICDAVAEDYSEREGLQSAEIALIPGFNYAGKKIYKKGDITLGTVMEIFPKPCLIIVVRLSGADVVRSLDRGSKSLPGECGGLHHCNHRLQYTIDVDDHSGHQRVSNVLFDGAPIDMERMYTVAITDGMGTGNFGFSWYKSAPRIVDDESAMQIQDLILMWLARHEAEEVNPSMGRIHVKGMEE